MCSILRIKAIISGHHFHIGWINSLHYNQLQGIVNGKDTYSEERRWNNLLTSTCLVSTRHGEKIRLYPSESLLPPFFFSLLPSFRSTSLIYCSSAFHIAIFLVTESYKLDTLLCGCQFLTFLVSVRMNSLTYMTN